MILPLKKIEVITPSQLIILVIVYSFGLGTDRARLKQGPTTPFFWYSGLAVTTIPPLYMTVIAVSWAWRKRKLVSEIIRRMCALRNRYAILE